MNIGNFMENSVKRAPLAWINHRWENTYDRKYWATNMRIEVKVKSYDWLAMMSAFDSIENLHLISMWLSNREF